MRDDDPRRRMDRTLYRTRYMGIKNEKKKASLELCTAAAALIVGVAGPNRCTFYECRFEVSSYFSNIKALDNYIETEKCPLQRSGIL